MKNSKKMQKLLLITVCGLSISALAQPKNDFDEDPGKVKAAAVLTVEQAWQQLPNCKFGDSLVPLKTIEKAIAVTPKNDAQRADSASKLGAILSGQNVTKDAKKFACRQLAIVGDKDQVSVLNTLLLGADEELSFASRYALERIPDASALQALRDALSKTKGATLAGVIDSLGARRDSLSIKSLENFVTNTDSVVAIAALNSLAEIGDVWTAKAFETARKTKSTIQPAAISASLRYATQLLIRTKPQMAAVQYEPEGISRSIFQEILALPDLSNSMKVVAWRGVVKTNGEQAAPMVIEALKSNDKNLQIAATDVIDELPKGAFITVANAVSTLPETSQIFALNAMQNYDVPAVRSAALEALKSNNENVRVASLNALAMSGDVSTIATLLKMAADGSVSEKGVAQNSLERLRGDAIDTALIGQMEKATPGERAVLAKALGARHAPNATTILLKTAGDVEANVRLAALEALAQTAQPNDVPTLLELQKKALNGDKRELTTLEKTTALAAQNGSDTEAALNSVLMALKEAVPMRKASLLRIAGAIGGPKSTAALQEAAKSNDDAVRDAAIRTLVVSSDQRVAPALLELAQNASNPTHKVLAFRGYVRLADDKTVKNAERLKMYQAALEAAPASEKKLVLGGLGNIGNADALKLVAPFLEDTTMREEAAAAVNVIATKMLGGTVAEKDKEPLRAALKKALEFSKNETQRKQSTDSLQKLG